jgi:hypothetical protein
MDDGAVRERAQSMADALVAGDVDRAIGSFSDELKRNLGEVLALLPLPAREADVETVEHSGSGYNVTIRLVGETDEVKIQTRWKDRSGEPTMVEASHLSRIETAPPLEAGEAAEDQGAAEAS